MLTEATKIDAANGKENPSLLVRVNSINGQQDQQQKDSSALNATSGDQTTNLIAGFQFPNTRQKENSSLLFSNVNSATWTMHGTVPRCKSPEILNDHVNKVLQETETMQGQIGQEDQPALNQEGPHDEGPTEEFLLTNGLGPVTEEQSPTTEQYEDEAQHSPPGFEGLPKYIKATRSSVRLRAKNGGKYVSAVDKARANRGFFSIAGLMQRARAKKMNKSNKPSATYLKRYEPLTKEHAEALFATVGVEGDGTLLAQVEAAIGGGNTTPITAN